MYEDIDILKFLAASVVVWITPGPDTMYIIARSIVQCRMAGVVSVLGISTGVVVYSCMAALGLSALLAVSASVFVVVKVLGAAYLVLLGIRAWKGRRGLHSDPIDRQQGAWQIYREGLVTNLLNPKVAVFFMAFLPQFITAGVRQSPMPLLFLGLLFVTGGTLYCLLVALMASSAGTLFRRNGDIAARLQKLLGCVYFALGINLLRQGNR